MSIYTLAPADSGNADPSWADGYTDGELAAYTGLSARRALARFEMALDYDAMYANGYWEAYANTAADLAQIRKQERARRSADRLQAFFSRTTAEQEAGQR